MNFCLLIAAVVYAIKTSLLPLMYVGLSYVSRRAGNYASTFLSENLLYLEPALDQIERSNRGVGDTAGQNSAESAQGKVLVRAELAAVLVCRSCRQLAAFGSWFLGLKGTI